MHTLNVFIPSSAAINANLCKIGGGSVSSKIAADGTREYWCVGGRFDGETVMEDR